MPDALKAYKAKRNFSITPEPFSAGKRSRGNRAFVIQKHWATRLHYDFRIELDGTMKSWAVPKGPSLDPKDKRMAVQVEDHPISYNTFEGEIPAKQYGAGKVIIWDKGTWEPIGDAAEQYAAGRMKFILNGHKLRGLWAMVRMKTDDEKKDIWLLIKEKDDLARAAQEYSIVDALPDSVANQPGVVTQPPKKIDEKIGTAPIKKADNKFNNHSAEPSHPPKSAVFALINNSKPNTAEDTKATKSAISKLRNIPEGAKKAALPDSLSPQLATLSDHVPSESGAWQYEIKFDGYRLLTRVSSASLRFYTRNGNDWTDKLPRLAQAVLDMRLSAGWYDGEIVVLNENGVPDFQRLQHAFDGSGKENIVYYLFDLPFYKGYDLRHVNLLERRKLLRAAVNGSASESVRFSEVLAGAATDIRAAACQLGLEGVIGKRTDSLYVERRSPAWIKLKCQLRQEFVIGGYTDPQGSRDGFGSLLLGVHGVDGKLHYAGNVGTGFDTAALKAIKKKLDGIAATRCPFTDATGGYRKAHWVKPSLLAEVSFAEWTADSHIRHAVFHALRIDKPAKGIVREIPNSVSTAESAPASAQRKDKLNSDFPSGIAVTHGERIIDPSSGTRKIDLIHYYNTVAPLMLMHLKNRPVSLQRAPDGIDGELFFQKHHSEAKMPGVRQLPDSLDPSHAPLLEIATVEGLLSAAQMNVIEFHTWNAVKSNIMKPDRMTFDLDPGENVDWSQVQQAAHLVRNFLTQLELESMIKTSGGKGLHVVVPIKKHYDWDTVKDFSHAIVTHLAKTLPAQFVVKSGPRNRVGKIFVDYLRNGFGATTVAAWSVRSRPGLGISVPITWKELEKVNSGAHWNIANIQTRLTTGNTPWDDCTTLRQGITRSMQLLGFDPKQSKK